jgi:hypothetical protein
MSWMVLGAIALVVLLALGRGFTGANTARLASGIQLAAALALIGVAVLLAVAGRWAIAVPVGLFAVSLLGYGGSFGSPVRRPRPTARSRPRTSTVSTALLEVELDHATGDVRGRVVGGPFAGRQLDALRGADLGMLWRSIDPRDRESRSLLEAYLDRRLPGWREDFQRDAGAGQRGAARAGAMSEEEAYETLGLRPGATEAEIRAAHRNLMKRVHPDMGGTAALAAKINEAKERLLGSYRKR